MGKIKVRTGRGTRIIEVDDKGKTGLGTHIEKSKQKRKRKLPIEWSTQEEEQVQGG